MPCVSWHWQKSHRKYSNSVAEIRLAHCQHHPAHAHPAADVLVDGIWAT
jgi:hypothetical protein